jgi:hypothetical protein
MCRTTSASASGGSSSLIEQRHERSGRLVERRVRGRRDSAVHARAHPYPRVAFAFPQHLDGRRRGRGIVADAELPVRVGLPDDRVDARTQPLRIRVVDRRDVLINGCRGSAATLRRQRLDLRLAARVPRHPPRVGVVAGDPVTRSSSSDLRMLIGAHAPGKGRHRSPDLRRRRGHSEAGSPKSAQAWLWFDPAATRVDSVTVTSVAGSGTAGSWTVTGCQRRSVIARRHRPTASPHAASPPPGPQLQS